MKSEILRSSSEAKRWLHSAAPGSRRVYHVGYLCPDRKGHVKKMADLMLEASDAREVYLLQRRLGPGIFEYLAEKRLNPNRRRFYRE